MNDDSHEIHTYEGGESIVHMRKSAVILLTSLNILTTLIILFILYIMFTFTAIGDPVTYSGQNYFYLYGMAGLLILIVIGIWIAFYQLVINIDPRWFWLSIVLGICLLFFSNYMPIIPFFSMLYIIAGIMFHSDK
jgi:hypothetical protein